MTNIKIGKGSLPENNYCIRYLAYILKNRFRKRYEQSLFFPHVILENRESVYYFKNRYNPAWQWRRFIQISKQSEFWFSILPWGFNCDRHGVFYLRRDTNWLKLMNWRRPAVASGFRLDQHHRNRSIPWNAHILCIMNFRIQHIVDKRPVLGYRI